MRTRQHLFYLVITAFAVVATLVPAAQAAGSPDDRNLYRGTSASLAAASMSPDDRALDRGTSAALAPNTRSRFASGVSPDDRSFNRGVSAALEPKSLSPDDRAYARGTVDLEPRSIPIAAASGGFDWGDAALGGSLGAVLTLIGAGVVLVAVRHRRGTLTPA
jgi:hypothetical protein